MERVYGGARMNPRKKKKKGPSMMVIMLILTFVILLGLIVYLAFFRDRERTIVMTETPIAAEDTYLNTGRGLLYAKGGDISLYSTDTGKSVYYGHDQTGTVRMSGSGAMSAVFAGGSLQIIRANGDITTMEFTGTIDAVELGTYHIAMLRRDSAGEESVLVLSAAGEQVDQILPGEQYVVDFGFYTIGKSEMLWVEMMSVTAAQPTETIRCYDLSVRSQTGAITVQNQLVEEVYITPNSLFLSGTNQIIRYTHDGNKEAYRVTDYGYRTLDFSDAGGDAVFLLTPRGGDMHSVKLLTLKEGASADTKETYMQLPGEGVSGFIMNNRLVVVAEKRLYIFSMKGKLTETANLQYPIERAEKLSDSMLLLLSNGKWYTASV
ncbi:MAG: hypothetical protein Q4C53_00040 [Clostridia bacterium]|nr:hypothetical protein [Clostridia bacterium]